MCFEMEGERTLHWWWAQIDYSDGGAGDVEVIAETESEGVDGGFGC